MTLFRYANKLPTDILISPSDIIKGYYTQDDLPHKWSIKYIYIYISNFSTHSLPSSSLPYFIKFITLLHCNHLYPFTSKDMDNSLQVYTEKHLLQTI